MFLPSSMLFSILQQLPQKTLTHLFPVHPFSSPQEHQKTVLFSDVFREWRKGALGTNGLKALKFKKTLVRKGLKNLFNSFFKPFVPSPNITEKLARFS